MSLMMDDPIIWLDQVFEKKKKDGIFRKGVKFLMLLSVLIDAGILIVALVILLVDRMLGSRVVDLFEFGL